MHEWNYCNYISSLYCDCILLLVTKSRKCRRADLSVPGWNTIAKEKHTISRKAYLKWKQAGRPREGPLCEEMKKARAAFKIAFRYCKEHAEEILEGEANAPSHPYTDPRKSWSVIYTVGNVQASRRVDGWVFSSEISQTRLLRISHEASDIFNFNTETFNTTNRIETKI